ncbi:MAG: hypothetical protein ABSG40_23960, partial [Terriglobales bacterium]
ATPTQLPQNPPGLRRMVLHSAFLLDQMGHAPRGPQAGFIPDGLFALLGRMPKSSFSDQT